MPRSQPGVRPYETSSGRKWMYTLDAGPDPATGKRRQIRRRGFATQKDADKARRAAILLRDEGVSAGADKMTFGEWLVEWLDRYSRDANARTIGKYQRIVHKTLIPHLGQLKLTKLHQSHLTDLYDGLRTGEKSNSGRPLKPATIQLVSAVVSSALKDAMRRDLVGRNVNELADKPKVQRLRSEERFWTPDQVNLFLSEARGTRYENLYRLLVLTGLRRAEALGLRWRNVDLEAGLLHVREQLVPGDDLPDDRAPGERAWKLDKPKTERSNRTVALGPALVDMLRAHQADQLAEQLETGVGNVYGLVFTSVTGYYVNPQSVGDDFKELVRRAAPAIVDPEERSRFVDVTLHSLRHTHATMVLHAGRNALEVSERLGHSSVAFTLDRYAHVIPKDAAAVAVAAERVLSTAEDWSG